MKTPFPYDQTTVNIDLQLGHDGRKEIEAISFYLSLLYQIKVYQLWRYWGAPRLQTRDFQFMNNYLYNAVERLEKKTTFIKKI